MGSLVEELKRREAAAWAEADRLRCRMEGLARDLARACCVYSAVAALGEHRANADPEVMRWTGDGSTL